MAESFDLQAQAVKVLSTSEYSLSIGESLAVGGYSRVFRAELHRSQHQDVLRVAAKKVRSESAREVEVCTLKQLNHRNIIKFHGLFRCDADFYIILELADNGDLFHFLLRYRISQENKNLPPRLPLKYVWKWVFEAASALAYLHSTSHNHRDVKSLNYLVMGDYMLKLGDMGMAKEMYDTQFTNKRRGTCQWMAPEVIMEQKRSLKSDVYSFGIVVWEICTTDVPYHDRRGDFDIMTAVTQGERPTIPADVPQKLAEIMLKCWAENYTLRPNMKTICEELQSCKYFFQLQKPTNPVPKSMQRV